MAIIPNAVKHYKQDKYMVCLRKHLLHLSDYWLHSLYMEKILLSNKPKQPTHNIWNTKIKLPIYHLLL